MRADSDVQARMEAVAHRVDFIELLDEEGPLQPRDVVESLPYSRATVTRALRELREADLVEKREGRYSPTLPGVMAAEVFRRYETASSAVLSADHLLNPIPDEHAFPVEILVDANTILAEGDIPVRAMEAVADRVQQATTVRAFLPTLVNTHLLRVWHRTLLATAGESTAVFSPDLLTVLKGQYPNLLAEMATVDGFSAFATTGPPYGLLLHTTDGEPAVTVIVYEDDTAVRGILTNDDPAAVGWARTRLEELQTDAAEVTAELEALSDAVADGALEPSQEHTAPSQPQPSDTAGTAPEGHTLPIDLETEGFVRLSEEYFDAHDRAPPAVSWRTGFTLAEVNEGYAVDRLGPDGRDLTELLLERLRDGTDQVVVGPPGSGKSTICMAVACEWFARGLGPVLYRERGGARFESAALLEAYLRQIENQGLVVVEDAIRDDANAIFEVMKSLGADSAVTFLLDARTHEWRSPETFDIDVRLDAYRRTAVERVEVPKLDERECERFVDHFTELVGGDHNLSGGELFELIEDGFGADGANGSPAGDALVAQYYLAKRYDPPIDSDTSVATALDEAVRRTYKRLVNTESGLVQDVAVLIAVLTAAGIPVAAEYLYAVGDAGEYAPVDEAISLLKGSILFEQDHPRVGSPKTYRTRHETWATRFLEAVRDTDPERVAQERFGRVVTQLLALADEPTRRQRLQRQLGGRTPHLHQIKADPQRWADELAERVFAIGLTNANLAPLFAETTDDTIGLPAACSGWIRLQQAYWRGEMNRTHGDLARAEREYRTLGELATSVTLPDGQTARPVAPEFTSRPTDSERDMATHRTRWRATSATRLGTVARERGEYDTAETHHREALEQFRAIDDPVGEAFSLKNLGIVAFYRSDYETARDAYKQSLELAREHGARRIESDCLNNLAGIAWKQGAFDQARQYLEEGLAISRDLGDEHAEYSILNNLGDLAQAQDDYDQAWDYYEQCLAIFRDFGDRPSEATILTNLGQVAEHQGAYEQAREYLEQSLTIKRELGDRQGETQTLRNLGSVALAQGAYEQARERLESSLNLAQDLGDKQGEAETHINLGEVAYRRGEDDRAMEHLRRGRDIARDLDAQSIAARSRTILGAVACRRGEDEIASGHLDAALETFEATGSDFGIARCRFHRGRLALMQGDTESARDQARAACEGFAEIGSSHWVGRARHLLGRVEAADDAPIKARKHWRMALEAFERADTPQDALTTLEALVELCRDVGDEDAAANWYRRAREVRETAPSPTAAIHGDWIETR